MMRIVILGLALVALSANSTSGRMLKTTDGYWWSAARPADQVAAVQGAIDALRTGYFLGRGVTSSYFTALIASPDIDSRTRDVISHKLTTSSPLTPFQLSKPADHYAAEISKFYKGHKSQRDLPIANLLPCLDLIDLNDARGLTQCETLAISQWRMIDKRP
jgi:hypothetical protein